jgi:hypothetical protein
LPRIIHQLVADGARLSHNADAMDLLNQNYLWASCIWGAIASGYLIYGWRQRATIPFVGGVAMTAASFLISSALLMSLACIALMFAVYWLLKQGY